IERQQRWESWLWVWPILFIVWANMHRGFVYGLALAFIAVAVFSGRVKEDRVRSWIWLSSCFLGTLLNPFGWKLYRMIWDDFSLSGKYIGGWVHPGWHRQEIFWILMAALWVLLVFRTLRREISFGYFFIFLFLTVLGSRNIFNAPFFMILAVPFM